MRDLRALIKEVLAEELAALRAELAHDATIECVDVGTSADLTRFALSVLDRARDPAFESALRASRLRFELSRAGCPTRVERPSPPLHESPVVRPPEALVTTLPPKVPELRKNLVTERDVAAIADGETRLRIRRTARLTPLAGDEARRRSIRIERTLP